MKKIAIVAATIVAAAAGILGLLAVESGDAATSPSAAAQQTQTIVDAAGAFLNSLDTAQRAKVRFDFNPQKVATAAKFARNSGSGGKPAGDKAGGPGKQAPAGGGPGKGPFGGFIGEQYGHAIWSNYPVSDVPRPGLRLGDLKPAQRAAAMHLLHVLLSSKGYEKVVDIMSADQALADQGTPYASGTDVYTLGIFGTPSTTAPWMIEFGGHHLGLNLTIIGEQGVLAPTMTGAQPALFTRDGKTIRPLGSENDKAFELLDALDGSQRKQAILNYEVRDLVLGPGHDGEVIQPERLKASAMNERQKAKLLDLISEWVGIANDSFTAPHLAKIKENLDDTYFAWSGPTAHEPGKNGSAYYRIQGPTVIIEFSPQGVGGDKTMHVHTVYRDPTNEYGRGLTAEPLQK